ncbi:MULTISPECIES: MFS transporter [unclassified Pseudomonas]|uniref:MFS transporter n=1 Tax=unclassified Pseudomonas TaxID=196821 RepID=UPI00119C584D|nr:putative MFS family arabinose efflux permease [Pseudomonas sp. SJZ075]TWC17828.1 putative MFS family arabinose efflux permease [Pseudomonas sp. SJZ074]TWC29700.1 putative MFS family arabinose efflux permease [Pseudomonas sp. SJZ078]TWC35746.1 putative MFS family arabinose efflux permease [Pseudomonas sp. SJZ085]TWC50386.1 putative MFS family arabinose efflux permease [Pseudomonas sp. SJZ124]TWC86114.1 putative MFS family arabinose efflux permease [Pseudomonas sp. SJZ101]
MFSWYRQVTARERKTFWACFGGWSLDALEVQMFGLAIPALIAAFALSKGDAGLISGVTLVTSALGGWVGGTLSDRYGRVRTLQWMILWFSFFTFLSAFVTGFHQLLVVKALQGFGIGGEWAAGAVLMAETINPKYRGKVMGTVQSAWAVGWGLAVGVFTLIYSFVPQDTAWRVMFIVGLLPSFLIIWVRRNVEEPDSFQRLQKEQAIAQSFFKSLAGIFRPELIRVTLLGGLLGLGAHGGYHAVMTWLPTFLKTERNLSVLNSGGYLAVIIFAFWCGCVVSGLLIDRIGRRKNIVLFALCCVVTVQCYVFLPLTNTQMLFLGFPLGFFAAGIPASLGALFNELYPADVRGAGVGFCYNFGRVLSAVFPFLVGHMSDSMSLGSAIGIDAGIAYGVAVLAALCLPETRGRSLEAAMAPANATLDGNERAHA